MTAVLDPAFLLADVRAPVAEPAQPGRGDDEAAVCDRPERSVNVLRRAVRSPDRQQVLLHQVHGAKLSADIAASALSTVLLWRGRIPAGLAVRYLLPPAASVVILPRDLSRLRQTRRGRYVLAHMTRGAEVLRLLGDAVMAIGAGRRRPALLVAGLVGVLLGWCRPTPRRRRQ